MGANAKYIPMTLRLENALYQKFHDAVFTRGNDKTLVLRKLVELYVKNPSIVPVDRPASVRLRA